MSIPIGFWAGPSSLAALLLHFDGAHNSTVMIDSSPNAFAMTAVGDAKLTTANSIHGGSSLIVDDNDRVISPASPLLKISTTADFTVEGWFRQQGTNFGGILNATDTPVAQKLSIGCNSAGALVSSCGNTPNGTIADNTWYYVAISRVAGTGYLFVNGTLMGTTPGNTATTGTGDAIWHFGASPATLGLNNALLDEWRVIIGVGLYTSSFTPPTPPLT